MCWKPLKNICEEVVLKSSYILNACKFTKTELLHRYFLGILTADSHGSFKDIFKKFSKMTKNVFLEHFQLLLQQIHKIKHLVLKSFNYKMKRLVEVVEFMVGSLFIFFIPFHFAQFLFRKNSHKIKIKRIQKIRIMIFYPCLTLLYSLFRIFFISIQRVIYCA